MYRRHAKDNRDAINTDTPLSLSAVPGKCYNTAMGNELAEVQCWTLNPSTHTETTVQLAIYSQIS
jgi:hypothetical protein